MYQNTIKDKLKLTLTYRFSSLVKEYPAELSVFALHAIVSEEKFEVHRVKLLQTIFLF